MHKEKTNKHAKEDNVPEGAVPAYLLDRQAETRAKVLSNTVKQKRKEKAGKWDVPIPKVKPVADDEMFKIVKTGKRKGTNSAIASRFTADGVFLQPKRGSEWLLKRLLSARVSRESLLNMSALSDPCGFVRKRLMLHIPSCR